MSAVQYSNPAPEETCPTSKAEKPRGAKRSKVRFLRICKKLKRARLLRSGSHTRWAEASLSFTSAKATYTGIGRGRDPQGAGKGAPGRRKQQGPLQVSPGRGRGRSKARLLQVWPTDLRWSANSVPTTHRISIEIESQHSEISTFLLPLVRFVLLDLVRCDFVTIESNDEKRSGSLYFGRLLFLAFLFLTCVMAIVFHKGSSL